MSEFIRELEDSAGVKISAAAQTATFSSEALLLQQVQTWGIVLDIGTVSGTSRTLDIKGQMSLDGGTTWLDTLPGALNSETQITLAQITATKETSEFWPRFIPSWMPSKDAEGGTTYKPMVKFVFTIGGTNPSFTFTKAYVLGVESAYR